MGSLLVLCTGNSRKYPYLPVEGIPPPLWKFQLACYISILFLALQKPPTPPPRKFQSLLWGQYGYFLELHIVARCDIQIELNK